MTAMAQRLEVGQFVEFVERPVRVRPEPRCHYMLRLHPNYEMKAERQLNERGVENYLPKEVHSRKAGWGRRRLCSVPIFAGVMFIPDFEANLTKLKGIAAGIGGFIRHSVSGEALPVSPYWMERIRNFEQWVSVPHARRRPDALYVGQPVRVTSGPFEYFEGKIERLDSHHRLAVLLTIFERETPVILDEDQVEAV